MPQKRKLSSDDDQKPLDVGDVLESYQDSYKITEFLGRGTFGQVFRCETGQKAVAIKYIMRKVTGEEREVEFLKKIRDYAEDFHLLALQETFTFNRHLCIVVEGLDCDLRTLLAETGQLPVPGMRAIVGQLLSAVDKLKSLHIIHCDIKPENIMMVDRELKPFSLKLIDFGCSLELEEYRGKVITGRQTRWYRAPEVILGLPCDEKIDIWSIGCVAAEVILGVPLYPGVSESHMLQCITDMQGMFDREMQKGIKWETFYMETREGWKLKSKLAGIDHEVSPYNDLQDLVEEVWTENDVQEDDAQELIILIKDLLALNKDVRISAKDALESSFLKMDYMEHLMDSEYYKISRQIMENCCVAQPKVLVEQQLSSLNNFRRQWKDQESGC